MEIKNFSILKLLGMENRFVSGMFHLQSVCEYSPPPGAMCRLGELARVRQCAGSTRSAPQEGECPHCRGLDLCASAAHLCWAEPL